MGTRFYKKHMFIPNVRPFAVPVIPLIDNRIAGLFRNGIVEVTI